MASTKSHADRNGPGVQQVTDDDHTGQVNPFEMDYKVTWLKKVEVGD